MRIEKVLRAALMDLSVFNDGETTAQPSVRDSAFCPGGRFTAAPTVREMPLGLRSHDFTTVGEWRAAVRRRLKELT